ncbi:hypothetical protein KJ891_05330, partial [Candidatus Micrarchaeota archaeon]|nr:hypothetical protein [Candidatus Micrarchaeota archaeon]
MAGRRAKGIMRLMRPAEWSKTFGNMIIGALLAAGFVGMDWGLFAAAFVAVGVFLWSGLYTLNDWVDWEHD